MEVIVGRRGLEVATAVVTDISTSIPADLQRTTVDLHKGNKKRKLTKECCFFSENDVISPFCCQKIAEMQI